LHDFILSEVEKSECSFWSETIDAEELRKKFFFFVVEKAYESRTSFCLMMVYPETDFFSDVFESDDFTRYTDSVADIIHEDDDVAFFDIFERADEECYHSLIVRNLRYIQVSFFL